MTPEEYYQQRLLTLKNELQQLNKRKSLLAWLRFAAVVAAIAAFYFLFPAGTGYAVTGLILCVAIFIRLVITDLNNKNAISHNVLLQQVNEEELLALRHQYHHFDDGHQFAPAEHPYANDLDITGRSSLYQYCNRTTSEMGATTLANWLLFPADTATIMNRQDAVKELKDLAEWRQEFRAYGKEEKITYATHQRLQEWLQAAPHFIGKPSWRLLQWIVPAIICSVIVLNVFDIISNPVRNIFLVLSAMLAFYVAGKIASLHQQVSKMADELAVMSNSVALMEQAAFKSTKLQNLQQCFKDDNGNASVQLKALKKIVERLDLRLNPVVFIPLAVLFQWDIHQAMALEKWKRRNKKHIGDWFNAIGTMEALQSFATVHFNHPQWCFPNFTLFHCTVEGVDVGHPLIPPAKRVNNFIGIHNRDTIMLVTGSNMAGKSTYLRSIGVNIVLAMAGAPVCAQSFTLSPVELISSMRIADNLEESTSTFYAELKKLKAIIEKVNEGVPVFILLDEILRGTNSLDRHTGSEALIRQLIKHHAACIIATHDVELAQLKNEFPDNIMNFHFDVQVEKEELYFDYQLKEGICTSLNASILMKKIGIEM
ncbi:MAG: hypothetical protein JST86_10495 [Bacteroidetes bacterium]|nr:hypothetical protein [Bacteroidota bacterium]